MSAPPRLEIFVCGGSQLAATGLPPTAVLPARMARGLRAMWGPGRARVRIVYCDVDPRRLAEQLAPLVPDAHFIVVFIPRNLPAVLGGWRDAARRLTASDLSLPAELPPSRPGASGRWTAVRDRLRGHLWYAAWVVTLPLRLARYWWGLESTIDALCRRGCRAVVLATPIPYPAHLSRRTRLYQRLLAAVIRRRAGRAVHIADLFGRLTTTGPEPIRPDDPHHLTLAGHQQAADVIVGVLGRLDLRSGSATTSSVGARPIGIGCRAT